MDTTEHAKQKGLEYLKLICDKCKDKLREQTSKLKPMDMLRPKKCMATLDYQKILCKKCLNKIIRVLKNGRNV